MECSIVGLPKEKWRGWRLPIEYTTNEYYDVVVTREENKFTITLELKWTDEPICHTQQEYDYPDKLYKEHWQGASAMGIFDHERLVAAVETCPEEWSNRLRVTELWVDEAYRGLGLGHALMEAAKEQAEKDGRRALILETQSCNAGAIGFYLHEGFTLIGLDTCAYHNDDLERKEVRLELGWFPNIDKEVE